MLQNLFIEILITSCIGAAVAGVLALIRPITQKHFSSRWHYYMWLVVLAVMMCPIRLNLPEEPHPPVSEATQISATQMATETIGEVNYTVSEPQTVINEPMQSEAVYQEKQETATESKVSVILSVVMGSIGVLPILWIAIAALLFFFKLISYGAFVLKMKHNSHITKCEQIKKYTRRKITVRTSNRISSPLMIGIIKPVLLLPDAFLTDEQLDNILKHEITHFKRHDILYKWFTAFAKCVHWFNPAIYFISRQINTDCEISCDMAVTADMSREEEIGYIDTILALVTRANARSIPLTTGMAGSKKILKKRFLTIRNRINTTKSSRTISRIAAVVTAAATLTASIAVLSGCDLTATDSTENEGTVAIAADLPNGDKLYTGEGFSIAIPGNAEVSENSYWSRKATGLLSAKLLSKGSLSVIVYDETYAVYDLETILNRYAPPNGAAVRRSIEDYEIITDDNGNEIGRSFTLVTNDTVTAFTKEYAYGDKTIRVNGQPLTGDPFDTETNIELIKKYVDTFNVYDNNSAVVDSEMTVARIVSKIFIHGDFTNNYPVLEYEPNYVLEKYDIPKDIVTECIFYRANKGAADEVAVIKTTDTKTVMEKLQEHIDKQIDKFKSDPREHEKLNDAVLVTYGDTVIFVVSENSESVRQTIANIMTE